MEGKIHFLESSFYYYLYEKVNLTLADHLISLAEAKPRKVGKSTYKSMNELLNAIKESGYNPEEDSPVAKVSTSRCSTCPLGFGCCELSHVIFSS